MYDILKGMSRALVIMYLMILFGSGYLELLRFETHREDLEYSLYKSGIFIMNSQAVFVNIVVAL